MSSRPVTILLVEDDASLGQLLMEELASLASPLSSSATSLLPDQEPTSPLRESHYSTWPFFLENKGP